MNSVGHRAGRMVARKIWYSARRRDLVDQNRIAFIEDVPDDTV